MALERFIVESDRDITELVVRQRERLSDQCRPCGITARDLIALCCAIAYDNCRMCRYSLELAEALYGDVDLICQAVRRRIRYSSFPQRRDH
jgi:hypothetical protein